MPELKLVLGRQYVREDGGITGFLEPNVEDLSIFKFFDPKFQEVYLVNGRYSQNELIHYPQDLIQEYGESLSDVPASNLRWVKLFGIWQF